MPHARPLPERLSPSLRRGAGAGQNPEAAYQGQTGTVLGVAAPEPVFLIDHPFLSAIQSSPCLFSPDPFWLIVTGSKTS